MLQLTIKHFFVFLTIIMFAVGCSKEVDIPPCTLVPITPTATHSDFKQFTLLGPEINGEVDSVFIHDKQAYIEVGNSLVIFDIHDPSQPVQLGSYAGGAIPFKIEDNYAYAYWDEKLHVLDISQPNNPVEVSCLESSTPNLSGAIYSDNLAYMPAGEEGLRIYDISELTEPVEVSAYQSYSSLELSWYRPSGKLLLRPFYILPQPMLALDIATSGHYAYVGEGLVGIDSLYGGQLSVLDISKPSKPKQVGVYTMPRNTAAMQVILDGNYAYVSTFSMYEAQLTVVLDISNPKHPVEVATFPTGALVAVYKGFAYFQDQERGLIVWDVSDPASPRLSGDIQLPLVFSSRYSGAGIFISDIAFDDHYAYIAMDYGGLHIFDIFDPIDAKEVNVIQYDRLPHAYSFAIDNNTAYLVIGGGNIMGQDLSKPYSLSVLGYIEGLEASDIAVSQDMAYVARDEKGVSIVDISDLKSPTIINTYAPENFSAHRIVEQDGMIYTLEKDVGLHIFDSSNPSKLLLVSSVTLNVGAYDDIAVRNDRVYVSMGGNDGELKVIDISEPTEPEILTSISSPEYFTSIAADDSFIYIVTSWDFISIFDIQKPDNPMLVSVHDSQNFLEDIYLYDGTLYLALRYGGGIASVELEIP